MTPNYVITLQEITARTKKVTGFWGVMRKIYRILVFGIVAVMILGSLIFWENLFLELTLMARILLIGCVIYAITLKGKHEDEITPIEFRFYEDRLEIFRNKCWYVNEYRRRLVTAYYSDISKIMYNVGLQRMTVKGTLHIVWHKYDKEGNLPEKPNYDRVVEKTCEFACLCREKNVDIIKEIETHTPFTVEIYNNQEAK